MTMDSGEAAQERIGDLVRGERPSDGDDRLCAHGHFIPEGQPLFWPANPTSQYDDSDPYCLRHAVVRAMRHGEITIREGEEIVARAIVDGEAE